MELYLPKAEQFAQCELIPSGKRRIYDKLKIDLYTRDGVRTRTPLSAISSFPRISRSHSPRASVTTSPTWELYVRETTKNPFSNSSTRPKARPTSGRFDSFVNSARYAAHSIFSK